MDTGNKTRLWVRWVTRDENTIERIRRRFGIPRYTTLNGFSPAEIQDEDMEILEETARRGFISIFREKWCKNGGTFSFPSRK